MKLWRAFDARLVMRYEFHPEALDELNEAVLYYARQQPGLDRRFLAHVEEAIELILEDPYRLRLFDEDVRRCLTRVFPMVSSTRSSRNLVLIVAVAHCSREPDCWKHRIAT